MIAAGMIAYYLLATGVVALVVWHAVRQNERDAVLAYDRLHAGAARWVPAPPMPEPLPEERSTDELLMDILEDAISDVFSTPRSSSSDELLREYLIRAVRKHISLRKHLSASAGQGQLIEALHGRGLERTDNPPG